MVSCPVESPATTYPEVQLSLQRCGEEEAQQFKWILSEQEGRDLGDSAIRSWIRQHWNGFLRHRWLEHLHGKAYWIELHPRYFGILEREFRNSPLLDPILERLKVLKENLDIIMWAQGVFSQEEMREVLCILEALDVNSCRIQCEFDPRRNATGNSCS